MRIAIISDIHGNYTALEVCIKKIEKMNVDIEKEIETGIDIPQQCLNEYNQIRKEHNIENDSIEFWKEALKNVFTKFTM